MTELTKDGIRENFNALCGFIAAHSDEWREFCIKERNGKQDIEEISMLITSTTSPRSWRVIVSAQKLDRMSQVIAEVLGEIKDKMKEHEKLVDGSV